MRIYKRSGEDYQAVPSEAFARLFADLSETIERFRAMGYVWEQGNIEDISMLSHATTVNEIRDEFARTRLEGDRAGGIDASNASCPPKK